MWIKAKSDGTFEPYYGGLYGVDGNATHGIVKYDGSAEISKLRHHDGAILVLPQAIATLPPFDFDGRNYDILADDGTEWYVVNGALQLIVGSEPIELIGNPKDLIQKVGRRETLLYGWEGRWKELLRVANFKVNSLWTEERSDAAFEEFQQNLAGVEFSKYDIRIACRILKLEDKLDAILDSDKRLLRTWNDASVAMFGNPEFAKGLRLSGFTKEEIVSVVRMAPRVQALEVSP